MVSSDLVNWLTPNLNMNGDSPELSERALYEKREVVAEWHVPLHGHIHKIEFEHGTASGKRVLWVDEKEVLRRDWMFKLVGEDSFKLADTRCIIRVDPAPGFKYVYSLFVGGKPFDQFTERQARVLKSWEVTLADKTYRVVLEKDTLNIWLNGKIRDETGEFVDDGADTEFVEDGIKFVLKSRSSGNKRTGIVHSLFVNDQLVNNDNEKKKDCE